MLDDFDDLIDLVEAAVDIGEEVVGALAHRRAGQKKQRPTKRKKGSDLKEPWEQPIEKPAWED